MKEVHKTEALRNDSENTLLKFYWPILIISMAGLLLRLNHLPVKLLGWDEVKIYYWTQRKTYWEIMTFYGNIGNHLFQTLLAKVSTSLISNSIEGARIPTLIFGSALVPVGYLFGRDVLRLKYPIVLATLIAGSSFSIFCSTNARGYEMQSFFVVMQLWLNLKTVENPGSWKYKSGWALNWILHFYTLPTAVWFTFPLFIHTLIERRYKEGADFNFVRFFLSEVVRYAIVGVVVAALYGIALLNPAGQGEVGKFYPEAPNYRENFAATTQTLFQIVPDYLTIDFGFAGKMAALVCLVIGACLCMFLNRSFFAFFAVLLAVLIVFNLPLKTSLPFRVYGFMFPLMAGLCCFTLDRPLGWVLGRIDPGKQRAALTAGCLCLIAVMAAARYHINDFVTQNNRSLVGAKKMVKFFGRKKNADKLIMDIYPQYGYWSEKLGIPLKADEVNFYEDRLVGTVRIRRETTDVILQRLEARYGREKLDQYDLKMKKIARFHDIELYALKFTKKTGATDGAGQSAPVDMKTANQPAAAVKKS